MHQPISSGVSRSHLESNGRSRLHSIICDEFILSGIIPCNALRHLCVATQGKALLFRQVESKISRGDATQHYLHLSSVVGWFVAFATIYSIGLIRGSRINVASSSQTRNSSTADIPVSTTAMRPNYNRGRDIPPPVEKAPPTPAKSIIIEELPRLITEPYDLESTPECPICLISFMEGDVVVRMPCSHLYCEDCLCEWLEKNCTCPTCRWELPTDDMVYEEGRMFRMRYRKPRWRRHELQRLLLSELSAMKNEYDEYDTSSKEAMITHLIESDAIQIIPDVNSSREGLFTRTVLPWIGCIHGR